MADQGVYFDELQKIPVDPARILIDETDGVFAPLELGILANLT